MNILIINDDGIKAQGLEILVDQMRSLGNIYIFAPEHHQSGKSQSLTIRKALKVKNYRNLYGSKQAYSAAGTPADCVRLALHIFRDIKFDFMVSGINRGANLGADVLHSGTVGAASAAASLGVPAVAVSSNYLNFSMAKKYTTKIIKHLFERNIISNEYVININFPHHKFIEPQGISFTTQGLHKHKPVFKQVGRNKYYALYELYDLKETEDSDVYCYQNGIISLTPIFEDRSKKSFLSELEDKTQLNEIVFYDKIK
ncbi:MAG: 5'/3'-nucleotidase SurE [Acholeplasmataceae bacterium]|jgi:5'-nucleotidase|nr:5'/3'-nucleotidase SurE [Acholeplasmataceae bacterium]